MNIFVLDNNPKIAAMDMDDVRVPKMCVESAQMMASALRRHGATDSMMPLTKAGTPYKGGHKHHPCTVWAGDTRYNFEWLASHAKELCFQYFLRFGKTHACEAPIKEMTKLKYVIYPEKVNHNKNAGMTPFAQAMPDEYKDKDAVKAYRNYYQSKVNSKGGVKYVRRIPPSWWEAII